MPACPVASTRRPSLPRAQAKKTQELSTHEPPGARWHTARGLRPAIEHPRRGFALGDVVAQRGLFSGNDERVFMTVNLYEDEAADPTIYEHGVHWVEIDPRTDTIVRDSVEPRWQQPEIHVAGAGGTTYYSPGAPITSYLVASAQSTARRAARSASCPRHRATTPAFISISPFWSGGGPAGGLSLNGNDVAFLRSWRRR